jgi:hypothetical protein
MTSSGIAVKPKEGRDLLHENKLAKAHQHSSVYLESPGKMEKQL